MKLAFAGIASLVLVVGNAHAALDMAAAEAMMKKDGCAACHAVDKKIIGPSYQEVAAKYKATRTPPRSSRKK